MIEDLRAGNSRSLIRADVCVIGGGPAGISICLGLIGKGLKVVLLEAGGLKEEPETRDFFAGRSLGHPMDPREGRHRVFGGSATRWGGRCAMLDPIDFEARPWVNESGWPLSMNELRPFYDRAKLVSNFKSSWDETKGSLQPLAPTTSGDLVTYLWRIASPHTQRSLATYGSLGYQRNFDWASTYKSVLAKDRATTVVLHAHVVGLGTAEAQNGWRVRATSLLGRNAIIEASSVILSCGGIETARLLLTLDEPWRSRVNAHDNVGRYFMQHPRGEILRVRPGRQSGAALQDRFNLFLRPPRVPVRYEVGFALSEAYQRRERLLNASVSFYYADADSDAWHAGRRLRDAVRAGRVYPDAPRDLLRLVQGGAPVLRNAWSKYVSGRELRFSDPLLRAVIDLEQEPNRDSRITLSKDLDPLGIPRVQIDWKIGEAERRTALYFARALATDLRLAGCGEAELSTWLTSEEPLRVGDLAGNYHFLATTRMASAPDKGVVDRNCEVFGARNLFACGTSVFPTGGHANPTLTVVALSIRLADYVVTRFLSGSITPVAA